MKLQALVPALLALLVSGPAQAQAPVALQIQNGRVTLKAQNAPLPQILAEWARIGGTKIVNGERVTGAPVTLELTNVPERQALDTLLRTVAGYLIAARPVGSVGQSAFDRILILPTSNPPRTPPAPAVATGPRPFVPPVAVAVEEPQQADDPDDNGTDGVQPATPRPAGLPVPGRVAAPIIRPVAPPPVIPQQPQPDPEPAAAEGTTQQGVAPAPGNPFGIPLGSSSVPGVIAPVPQQPNQQPQR